MNHLIITKIIKSLILIVKLKKKYFKVKQIIKENIQINYGKREGRGIIKWDNGDIYNGEWKEDKKEGKGIYCFNNGQRYEGDWVNDKKEGRGIYYWNNGKYKGDRYDGEWKNDNYEGNGIYYYNDGSRYIG